MLVQIHNKSVWLNYNHLYYFKVISTEGSIVRAAKKLRIGQPTLSAQLKQLEQSLGSQLFSRNNRKLTLTETGKVVLNYANEIFRMGSEMVEVLQDGLFTKKIHVQIGALDSVPKHVILALTKAALKNEDCSVSVLEGKADELFRELSAHRIDMILSNFVPMLVENTGFYSRLITRAPVIVCGSNQYKSLRKGFPKSIANQPFILPTSHSKLRQDFEHYFQLRGIPIKVIAESQDTAVQKLMGTSGLGLVPLSEPAIKDHIKKKELFEIGRLDGVFEELFLVSHSRKISNPISSKLMNSFRFE